MWSMLLLVGILIAARHPLSRGGFGPTFRDERRSKWVRCGLVLAAVGALGLVAARIVHGDVEFKAP